jgi:hypothetical protein
MKQRKQKPVRMYRGIPVREARASIHVQPNQRDIDTATRESPTNCAYAVCLRRVLNSPSVFVFKTKAYIQTLDEMGVPIMERYIVKKYAREYLMRFDHGEKVPPGGFVFHRPPRSATLSYKQKQQRARTKAGKVSPRRASAPKVKARQYLVRTTRDGKGMIHLFGNEDQIRTYEAERKES